ncbi:MAG: ThiF family adenylyltransferase [Deltaproteobacteria bacterium]|nr:ThiF family adenylyltransferase [Deltaproteobacteria bacterium]
MLSENEALRFGRNVLLPEIGVDGQERLRASIVRLGGLGAVGSATALYLAAAGIGGLDVEDDGPVEPADLAGTLFTAADVGTPRVVAATRALAAFDSGLKINAAAGPARPVASLGAIGDALALAGGPDALLAGALLATETVKAILGIGEPMKREASP